MIESSGSAGVGVDTGVGVDIGVDVGVDVASTSDALPTVSHHPPVVTARRPVAAWSAEVQALRALAVGLVLAYHLWPGRVTGGYVGVDVFFVISGFLITGHILRDLDADRFSLRTFYVRRALRLLPAAMLVLLVTALGVVAVLPQTWWIDCAQQLLASAGYVQNWVLAGQDVDYLSPHVRPTPVQHFWSLSVEEQFYIGWPIALLLTARLTRRAGRRARVRAIGGMLLLAVACSFAYGVRTTASDAAGAYFFSAARIWEFAAGGVLALVVAQRMRSVPSLPRRVRVALCWAGLAAIVAAALLYTDRTPFPGTAALIPVAGTLAVIAAGRMDGAWSPAGLVNARPTQLLGDISYSLYLWHWPLIMLVPVAVGQPKLAWPGKLAILALSLALAWCTTKYVESRGRMTAGVPLRRREPRPGSTNDRGTPEPPRNRHRSAFRFIAATGVLTVAVAGGAWHHVTDDVEDARLLANRAISARTPCFGALAMSGPGCERPPFGPDAITPRPAGALLDLRNSPARRGCFTAREGNAVKKCSWGPRDADVHLVLLGDSHALQWFGALREIARQEGWRLTTLLRASCIPSNALMHSRNTVEMRQCHTWATRALDLVAADSSVDAVVTTAYNNKQWVPERGLDAYATGVRGYQRTWERLTAGGRHVAVLTDTPRPRPSVLECVAGAPDAATCRRPRDEATGSVTWPQQGDPMVTAVRQSDPGSVHMIDMTESFCHRDSCPAVIGNVLVYADDSHMTPTFSRSLAPVLRKPLLTAFGLSGR